MTTGREIDHAHVSRLVARTGASSTAISKENGPYIANRIMRHVPFGFASVPNP